MNKKTNKLFIVVVCVLSTIILINISFIIKGKLMPEKVPELLGYKPMIIISESMSPKFSKGDLVIVKETNLEELQQGEIISYRTEDNAIVTHRIEKIINENGNIYIQTKGDKNQSKDPIVITKANYEGKYLFHIPQIGNFYLYISTTSGMIAFSIITFLFGVIIILISEKYAKKKIIKNNTKLINKDEYEEFLKFRENSKNS